MAPPPKVRAPHQAEVLTVEDLQRDVMDNWPLPNVWLGTSVENQEQADKRIPHLLQTPAAVRFLSIEPLLGRIDLTKLPVPGAKEGLCVDALKSNDARYFEAEHHVDWVIVGGESGHGARPMHPDWARSLRDQCVAAGVAFFFKQWGEYICEPIPDDFSAAHDCCIDHLGRDCAISFSHGERWEAHAEKSTWQRCEKFDRRWVLPNRVGKKAAGRLLDGREWNEMPEVNRG